VGTYLRIHASKPPGTKGSTGPLASVDSSFNGFTATPPYYFECRLIAQSAPGTWPAFWTLTKTDRSIKNDPCDELDVLEAYGGQGKGNPNYFGYSVTSHFWSQKGPDGKPLRLSVPTHKSIDILALGGKSTWSTTFHTYGLKVTKAETIYYFDDLEVLRHPSGTVSQTKAHYFLINYAIGAISGWMIHLEREGDASDMYVDFRPGVPGRRRVGWAARV
jgi:beta-glucanase (GH16 family)